MNLLFLSLLFIMASCKVSYYEYEKAYAENAISVNKDSVILTIKPYTYEFADSLFITVTIKNKTSKDFFIIKYKSVTMSSSPSYVWDLLIMFNDSIRMISPINFFDPRSYLTPPAKEYYSLVKGGDIYTFDFYVDFTRLVRTTSKFGFGPLNIDYGEYSMKLIFKDRYCNIKDAFCEQIESNIIKVNYLSQLENIPSDI